MSSLKYLAESRGPEYYNQPNTYGKSLGRVWVSRARLYPELGLDQLAGLSKLSKFSMLSICVADMKTGRRV